MVWCANFRPENTIHMQLLSKEVIVPLELWYQQIKFGQTFQITFDD